MSIIEPTVENTIENLALAEHTSQEDNQQPTGLATDEHTPNLVEPDSDISEGETDTETTGEDTPPAPTPEEILQEEEQKKQQELLWRQKQEEGKLRQAQAQNQIKDEALVLASRILNPSSASDALIDLVRDPVKFEQLKPELIKAVPSLADYSYDRLYRELVETYQQQAQTDPNQAQNAIKLETAKIVAQEQARANEEIQKVQVQIVRQNVNQRIYEAIPEYKTHSEKNPNEAEADFYDAVNLATIEAQRLARRGQVITQEKEIELIINSLYSFNPDWKQKKQEAKNILNNISSNVNQAVKAAGITSNNSSSMPSVIANLPKEVQKIWTDEVSRYKRTGLAEKEAKQKAMWVVEEYKAEQSN
jgi:hypothetical protein